eukprot:374017_1
MPDNGLKQYIWAKKTIQPRITVVEMVKDVRSIAKYRKLQYKSLHQKISRIFTNNTIKRKKRTSKYTVRIPANIKMVKKLVATNKGTRKSSTRSITKQMNKKQIKICRSSVRTIMKKDLKLKHKKKRKVQKLKPHHKISRVETAKYLRSKYGVTPRNQKYGWNMIINTDFSGYIRCIRKTNIQNDGIWVDSDDDEEILDKGHEKYSPGVMLFGGIRKQWKLINSEICSKMMHSIPRRLKAVIDRNGEQIHKKDYTTK